MPAQQRHLPVTISLAIAPSIAGLLRRSHSSKILTARPLSGDETQRLTASLLACLGRPDPWS